MLAENLCMGCMKEIGNAKQCPHCGFHRDTPQITPYLPLQTLISERYVVGKVLSSGGDGVTYMGWDSQTQTPVTIREFLPQEHIKRLYGTAEVTVNKGSELPFYDGCKAFLELWRKLARGRDLQGLIPVLDIVEENNTAYAVSEYLETITLRDFLLKSRTGYLSWDRVKSILMPLLTTISALHSMGVYHLGISPSTLVLGRDGRLRLTGFMINEARCYNTKFNAELYSGYAAVEQYSYIEDTGAWTDVYALAGVIYRALIGSTPVDANERITNDKLMIPPKFAETLPAYLISALEHAIMIEPADRTNSIDELREELSGSPSTMASNQVKEPEPSKTTDEELLERKRLERIAVREQHKQQQIKMAIIAFAVVFGIGLLALGGYFGYNYIKENPKETATAAPVSELIEVPDFVGQNYSRITGDAVQQTRFKFTPTYEYSDTVEAGFIISQNLEKGSQVEKGSEMKLVVSKGIEYIVLPDVTGSDYQVALQTLTQAGFVCKKIEKNNDGSHTPDEVVALTPEAGGTYEKGKEIYVQVWGPAPTTTTTTAKTLADVINDGLNLLP
ncbi:MAG: PASTA domain-containing protein [Clostridia bacterium]|nr:PASTA domain-containing protein [Clostridia bacterium]